MSGFGFEHIEPLFLAPLALLPLLRSVLRGATIPSLLAAPVDGLSIVAGILLKFCGVVAIGASLFGAASPYVAGADVERFSEGAQIVMLIDRSGSMNETFAGRTPSGGKSRRPRRQGAFSSALSKRAVTISWASRRFRRLRCW